MSPSPPPSDSSAWRMPTQHAVRAAVLAIVLAAALFVLWEVRLALVLAFGAVLMAILLDGLASVLSGLVPVSKKFGLAVATCIVGGVILATFWLFGSQIGDQFSNLMQSLRTGEHLLGDALANSQFSSLTQGITEKGGSIIGNSIASILSLSLGFLEAAVVWAITAIYLAAQPQLYREGLAQLFPRRFQPRMSEGLVSVGAALRLWLFGQLVLMISVGVLSFVAFWLIGLPNPLVLAFIAGVAEIVPYLGPFISVVPAVLVALSVGIPMVVWTLFVYLAIHVFEGYIVAPLISRRFVTIPPALTLIGIVAAEQLFGMAGIILAAPIAVMLYTAVKVLYVRDVLGYPSTMPRKVEISLRDDAA